MKLILSLLATIVQAQYFTVPRPSGPYGVSIEDVVLTDDRLRDPYLNTSLRRIVASIISSTGPVMNCMPVLQPYMPLPTAQFWEQAVTELIPLNFNYTFSETTLQLCNSTAKNTSEPMIVFAPGAQIARQLYHILMMNLVAQTGYTIVTYDQPGYADFEWFPDGEIEMAQQNFTFGGPVKTLVQDAIFILDALNYSKTAVWGHSEGGEVAAGDVIHDKRFLGGINLDGGFYSNYTLLNHTTSTPFAFFSRTGQDQANALTPWSTAWQNLKGSKWQLQLNESTHYSFSDAPYLVRKLYNLTSGSNTSDLAEAIGTIPGETAIQVIPAMGAAIFDFVFGKTAASSVVQRANSLEWFTVQNVSITQ